VPEVIVGEGVALDIYAGLPIEICVVPEVLELLGALGVSHTSRLRYRKHYVNTLA
jgi:hypothetical protein